MTRKKKSYRKPEISRVELDNSISLVMMTVGNPDPRDEQDKKGTRSSDPFASPFDNNPFG